MNEKSLDDIAERWHKHGKNLNYAAVQDEVKQRHAAEDSQPMSVQKAELASCWLKIDRAKEHFATLRTEIALG